MKLETNQQICVFLGFANMGLAVLNGSYFNLWIGIAMVGWVIFLESILRQK